MFYILSLTKQFKLGSREYLSHCRQSWRCQNEDAQRTGQWLNQSTSSQEWGSGSCGRLSWRTETGCPPSRQPPGPCDPPGRPCINNNWSATLQYDNVFITTCNYPILYLSTMFSDRKNHLLWNIIFFNTINEPKLVLFLKKETRQLIIWCKFVNNNLV